MFNKAKIQQPQDWDDTDNRRVCKLVLSSLYYSTVKYCALIDRCEMGANKLKSLIDYIANTTYRYRLDSFSVSERKLMILSLIRIFMSLENAQTTGSLSVLSSSLAPLSHTLANVTLVNAEVKKSLKSESTSESDSGSEHSFLDYQDTHVTNNNGSYDSDYEDDSDYDSEEESEELAVKDDEYRILGQYINSSPWAQSLLSHTLGQSTFAQLVNRISHRFKRLRPNYNHRANGSTEETLIVINYVAKFNHFVHLN